MPLIKNKACYNRMAKNLFILFFVLVLTLYAVNYCFSSSQCVARSQLSSRSFYLFVGSPIHCIIYLDASEGRLGNHMFMVASAYGLARLHGCRLYLTPAAIHQFGNYFELNFSNILLSQTEFKSLQVSINNQSKFDSFNQYVACSYMKNVTVPKLFLEKRIMRLLGYWQSYLYFDKYREEICEDIFVARSSVLEKVAAFFEETYRMKMDFASKLSRNNSRVLKSQLKTLDNLTWIGIHIRRTDFIELGYASSSTYLFKAMEYYIKIYHDAYFIVASDDKLFCESLFHSHSSIRITPKSFSPQLDLITLSMCEHSIITSGTFSWWSGFLANGLILYDDVYKSGCKNS